MVTFLKRLIRQEVSQYMSSWILDNPFFKQNLHKCFWVNQNVGEDSCLTLIYQSWFMLYFYTALHDLFMVSLIMFSYSQESAVKIWLIFWLTSQFKSTAFHKLLLISLNTIRLLIFFYYIIFDLWLLIKYLKLWQCCCCCLSCFILSFLRLPASLNKSLWVWGFIVCTCVQTVWKDLQGFRPK